MVENKILNFIKMQWDGFLHIIYPEICIACNDQLIEVENAFCFDCYSKLPFSYQINEPLNDFVKHFEGKVNITHGAALFYFIKSGVVQNIIKKLKYHDKPDYGIKMGEIFGRALSSDNKYGKIDIVIPVPLHPKKESKRGYNQSLMFAKGIANVLKCEINSNNLIRIKNTITQTKLSNQQRMKNVHGAFKVIEPIIFENKHILIVDDVLTTGSTLMACYFALESIKGVNISFATIASGDLI